MTRAELIGNLTSEFLPVTSFVLVSEIVNFEAGLKVLIVTTLIALVLSIFIERRLPKFGLLSAGIIIFFATLSMGFDKPFFIIFKDTLYYFGSGTTILVGHIIGRSPLKYFFGDYLLISENGWKVISILWVIFFYLLATGNEIARYLLKPDDWTLYKLVALFTTWVFIFSLQFITRKERLPGASILGLRIESGVKK